jgi:hypothetical protein
MKMIKLLGILKNLSGWIKGGIGFLVAIIAAILIIRDNPQLTVVIIIAIVDIAALVAVAYIEFYKIPSPITVGRYIPKYPKQRPFAVIGLVMILIINIGFFISPFGEKTISIVRYGTPTFAPTVVPENKPAFEINYIGLPYKNDNSYYVTDAMVRTNGDLSAYDQFTFLPLQVEIIPNYSGAEKFANIVLRLGGDKGTKDIKVWDDFDKDSKPKTVTLELADIIALSGIQENRLDIATNLGLKNKPFQQATLDLQIIPLSNTSAIWSKKTLIVINTPWTQKASIVSRNGLMLDYALENLGPDAKFNCRVAIAKTLSDVNASESEYWSGIAFSTGIKCDSFVLKTGEVHTASIFINSDTVGRELGHGRYLIEVYTFPERGDISFDKGFTYDSSSQTWVIANPGNILTFVICNDPGKTCEQTATMPIEKTTTNTNVITSSSDLNNGSIDLETRTYPVGNYSANQYIVGFHLDPEQDSFVGLSIWFEQPIDVSDYSSIRCKMTLDSSQLSIWMDVKDFVNGVYAYKRFKVVNAKYGSQDTEEQTIVVPFSEYTGIDWTRIDSLVFVVDSNMVPNNQHYEFKISEIEFIR